MTTNLKVLRASAPELFVNGYSRRIQRPYQPILLQRNEVKAWREQTFTDAKGNVHHCQAMPFPPLPNPLTVDPDNTRVQFWFGASNNRYPYPGIKHNLLLPNREQYPFLPYCGIKDQLSTSTSLYNLAADGEVEKKVDLSEAEVAQLAAIKERAGKVGVYGTVLTDGKFRLVLITESHDPRAVQRGSLAKTIRKSDLYKIVALLGISMSEESEAKSEGLPLRDEEPKKTISRDKLITIIYDHFLERNLVFRV